MANPEINPKKIVILSGAGISAPSGLATFRDSNGLWNHLRLEDVATPEAWKRQPEVVLAFYNERRSQARAAHPNAGHLAIAALEKHYQVTIITQNVDDLHERAGSSRVIHLHGELDKARSTSDPSLIYELDGADIAIGDMCAKGRQLRPHIVWFGEDIHGYDESVEEMLTAGKVVVVGTSLSVFPAAGLVKHARYRAEKVIVDLEIPNKPFGFQSLKGSADIVLPQLVEKWLKLNETGTT